MTEPRISVKLDDVPTVHQLVEALQDDSFWVRERAAEMLGASRSPDAVAGLLSALNDRTSTVRERAAEALARIGSDLALTGLVRALGESKASELTARVGSKVVVDHIRPERSKETLSSLHEILRKGHYQQRWHAARSLWKLTGAQAIDALLQALQELPPDDPCMQQGVNATLLAEKPDEYTLLDALTSQHFQVAWYMARDLVRIEPEYAAMICERVLDTDIG